MERFAAIDIGTNTVLLLVAERWGDTFKPLVEEAEITRLGRGVDKTGRLDPAALRATVDVLARYVATARAHGVQRIACVATSAARDASNGAEFFAAAREAAGIVPEIISGDEEARLVYTSAWRDFGSAAVGRNASTSTLAVLDVGGGSTEFTYGNGPLPQGRKSLQIGSVRLSERLAPADPMTRADSDNMRTAARQAVRALSTMDGVAALRGGRMIGVAGTVTTLAAVEQELRRYDALKVHGSTLTLKALEKLFEKLARLTVAERARLPGIEPKRADVIVAGCAVVIEAMAMVGFEELLVSDRGVRWGLLYDAASLG